jgi:hypothetical protein
MQIKKERFPVKKRKDDFMLLTASTDEMYPWVLAEHNFYKGTILNKITAKMAASASASTPALETVPASACVSAMASSSTPASISECTQRRCLYHQQSTMGSSCCTGKRQLKMRCGRRQTHSSNYVQFAPRCVILIESTMAATLIATIMAGTIPFE